MKRLHITLAAILIFFVSCSDKKKNVTDTSVENQSEVLIHQIQKTSKLYTSEIQIHKIITHSDTIIAKVQFLNIKKDIPLENLGIRKIAIPIDATVKTYIDFSNFGNEHVRIHNQHINITLPDPKIELTSTKINHKEIKEQNPFLRSDFTDEELANYAQQGRDAIIKSIAQANIIETAKESAIRQLLPILRAMGYKDENITITFRRNVQKAKSKN